MSVRIVAATLIALCGYARAESQFQVEPTRVDLSAAAPAGAIEITNRGTTVLRLQLSAQKWHDDKNGAMQLEPSNDVIVRPALVEIAPGRSRTIRVGTVASAAVVEGSYRVFAEELPDRGVHPSMQVQVRTRIGVPVFIAPKQRGKVALTEEVVLGTASDAKVVVANAGTQHVKLTRVAVTARHQGAAVWRHEAAGWYVLSGAQREFSIALADDACKPGDTIEVQAIDEDGLVYAMKPRRCDEP